MEKLAVGIGQVRRALANRNVAPVVVQKNVCPTCDGTGVELTTDEFGRTFSRSCATCGGLDRIRERAQFRAAKIPRLPERVDVAPAAARYVADFKRLTPGSNWILFSGRAGSGKTTNAAWIATEIITRYKLETKFYPAYDIVRRIATTKSATERDRLIDEAVSTPFVVLDDFLKIFPNKSSYQYSDFFEATLEIVWGRYDARRPLAITTQRDFRFVAEFDAALAGRIVESCDGRIVSFGADAKNWRLRDDP